MGDEDGGGTTLFWTDGHPVDKCVHVLTFEDVPDASQRASDYLCDPGEITFECEWTPSVLAMPQLLGIYRLIKKGRKLTGKLEAMR